MYLMTGLYGGKSLGTLEAFLPSPDYELIINGDEGSTENTKPITTKQSGTEQKEEWFSDYNTALAEAKRLNKPIFIDFTGVFCTNCRWMETNIFPRSSVNDLMNNMVRVRLYTDRKSEADKWNKDMMMKRFNSIELPLYAIVDPNDKILETQSFTKNQAEFIDFLKKGTEQK